LRHQNLDGGFSAHADVACEGAEAGMVGDVVVVDVSALGDGVVEALLGRGVPHSQEGDTRDGEGNA
jgi:hypothetical protein